jgi:PAS domain S-box-containing protein
MPYNPDAMPTNVTPRAAVRASTRDAQKCSLAGKTPLTVLGALIDAVPLATLVADDHGRYVLANAPAAQLTEYSRPELRRLWVWDLTPGPTKRDFEVLWRAFIQQREQRGAYELVTKTGRVVTAEYAARANVLPHLHVSVLRVRQRRARKKV